MSFREKVFAPVAFEPVASGSPWMIFDDEGDTFIISPASHFSIQRIGGDVQTRITSDLRETVRNIPAGFTQETLVVYGKGINRAWDDWGRAMTDLQGKTRPANDADAGLKYLGYWTDNQTHYYYNFDPKLGYGGTLIELARHFRDRLIPVKYLQLDSWWYFKTLTGPDGKIGKAKNAKLPAGEWNRYGGLLEYKAHPAVLPGGLQEFQRQLGLPLITHNRWIDPASPYRQKYRISGYAAVDPAWWREIIGYVHDGGAITYEQDWLSEIYFHSPELASSINAGDEFLDGMANAAAGNGMSMQYCMALPCDFLQGSKYENLTTIRTSDDGLKRDRWHNFLYTSRLASALGIWPWTDAYFSSDTGNILLSDLSAGMVGFGDEMGKESQENIYRAVRKDGVIVKPDVPIVPVDSAYIAEANGEHRALVASTYTDHDGIKTEYVLAFAVPSDPKQPKDAPTAQRAITEATISMNDLGIKGPAYAYDFLTHSVQRLEGGATFNAQLGSEGFKYFILAQPGPGGIAFFGDVGKFVSNGKQRIASLHQDAGKLTAEVLFAPGDGVVTLHGCCASPVRASVEGTALPISYEPASGHFSVNVDPKSAIPRLTNDGIGHVDVVLQTN
jgi:hypothetical protein